MSTLLTHFYLSQYWSFSDSTWTMLMSTKQHLKLTPVYIWNKLTALVRTISCFDCWNKNYKTHILTAEIWLITIRSFPVSSTQALVTAIRVQTSWTIMTRRFITFVYVLVTSLSSKPTRAVTDIAALCIPTTKGMNTCTEGTLIYVSGTSWPGPATGTNTHTASTETVVLTWYRTYSYKTKAIT